MYDLFVTLLVTLPVMFIFGQIWQEFLLVFTQEFETLPEICGMFLLGTFWILALTNLSLRFGGRLYATIVLRLCRGVRPLAWSSMGQCFLMGPMTSGLAGLYVRTRTRSF